MKGERRKKERVVNRELERGSGKARGEGSQRKNKFREDGGKMIGFTVKRGKWLKGCMRGGGGQGKIKGEWG